MFWSFCVVHRLNPMLERSLTPGQDTQVEHSHGWPLEARQQLKSEGPGRKVVRGILTLAWQLGHFAYGKAKLIFRCCRLSTMEQKCVSFLPLTWIPILQTHQSFKNLRQLQIPISSCHCFGCEASWHCTWEASLPFSDPKSFISCIDSVNTKLFKNHVIWVANSGT